MPQGSSATSASTVTVHGYWLGGYTSDQVLDIIQSDEVLRAALSSADVIVFEVPIGEVRSECPWDNVEWHPLPGTPTEWEVVHREDGGPQHRQRRPDHRRDRRAAFSG